MVLSSLPLIGYMKTQLPSWVNRLNDLMLEDDLNQTELADRLKLHKSTVSKYFSSSRLNENFVNRLEKHMGYSEDYIRFGRGPARVSRISNSLSGETTNTRSTSAQGVGENNVVNAVNTTGEAGELARLKQAFIEQQLRHKDELLREKEEKIRLLEELNRINGKLN